jgi:hypothetical protein
MCREAEIALAWSPGAANDPKANSEACSFPWLLSAGTEDALLYTKTAAQWLTVTLEARFTAPWRKIKNSVYTEKKLRF